VPLTPINDVQDVLDGAPLPEVLAQLLLLGQRRQRQQHCVGDLQGMRQLDTSEQLPQSSAMLSTWDARAGCSSPSAFRASMCLPRPPAASRPLPAPHLRRLASGQQRQQLAQRPRRRHQPSMQRADCAVRRKRHRRLRQHDLALPQLKQHAEVEHVLRRRLRGLWHLRRSRRYTITVEAAFYHLA
jgi:hypothetical protein